MPRIADEAPPPDLGEGDGGGAGDLLPLDPGQQAGGISGAAGPEGLARRGPDGGADGR